jgi:hypothetical protein
VRNKSHNADDHLVMTSSPNYFVTAAETGCNQSERAQTLKTFSKSPSVSAAGTLPTACSIKSPVPPCCLVDDLDMGRGLKQSMISSYPADIGRLESTNSNSNQRRHLVKHTPLHQSDDTRQTEIRRLLELLKTDVSQQQQRNDDVIVCNGSANDDDIDDDVDNDDNVFGSNEDNNLSECAVRTDSGLVASPTDELKQLQHHRRHRAVGQTCLMTSPDVITSRAPRPNHGNVL